VSSERVFNIFVYFEDGAAREYGVRHHRIDGDDATKMAALVAAVAGDHPLAKRFVLSRAFTPAEWLAQQRLGVDLALFEEGVALYRAGRAPLYCLTSIVDGAVRADIQTDLGPHQGERVGEGLPGTMDDWLQLYTEGRLIRIDRLINDDYFSAIRLLFNARHIASASKLLMTCIDTLAFLEYGDEKGVFVRWLNVYADLESVGVTAAELWEFRNSMVHMTNVASRAVLAGKAKPLMPYIGADELSLPARSGEHKPFNLYTLILAVAGGVKTWAESYNAERDKFAKFVERYDTIISDTRMATFQADPVSTPSGAKRA